MTETEQPQRTRFDNFRRTRILIIAGVAVVLILVLGGLASAVERRSADVRPRNIDIWLIYPDDRVNFTSLVYPAPPAEGPVADVRDDAGPLFRAEEDILSEEIIGGELLERTVSNIEANPEFFYAQYSIDYVLDSNADPYGIQVEITNAPYVTPAAIGDIRLAQFLAPAQSRYAQVIVAVGVPTDATNVVTTNPDQQNLLQPYNTVTIGGWVVYYYDTTSVTDQSLIYIEYTPGESQPDALNPIQVDRQR